MVPLLCLVSVWEPGAGALKAEYEDERNRRERSPHLLPVLPPGKNNLIYNLIDL
jgi:hypothetical protein